MIDIKEIRKNPEKFKTAAEDKRLPVDIDKLLDTDSDLRKFKKELQGVITEKNKLGKLMPLLLGDDRARALNKLKSHKKVEAALSRKIKNLQPVFDNLMLYVSQLPDEDVPVGKDDRDNVEVQRWTPDQATNEKPINVQCPTCGKFHKLYCDAYKLCPECDQSLFKKEVIRVLGQMRLEMLREIRDKFHLMLDLMGGPPGPPIPDNTGGSQDCSQSPQTAGPTEPARS